jgi:hypothetical protein
MVSNARRQCPARYMLSSLREIADGLRPSTVGLVGGIVWIAYGLQLRPVQEARAAEVYGENI